MTGSTTRLVLAASAAAALALVLSAAAPSRTVKTKGSAQAYAIRILVPNAAAGGTEQVVAPPDGVSVGGSFAYPADGSVVTTASATARVSTSVTSVARATASAEVADLSLFGGEVTAELVTAHAGARASTRGTRGDTSGTGVAGLTVLGQPAEPGRVALGDWGFADAAGGTSAPETVRGGNAFRSSSLALSIRLTVPHAGLPAGTQILVGFAEAAAQAVRVVRKPKPEQRRPEPPERPAPKLPAPPEPKPGRKETFGPPIRTVPQNLTPRLTPQGYVFPVFGPSSWSDTFGAPRATTGWHHGADIFAQLGAPVLAANDGIVFSVGWIPIGGNRFWLRDDQGNQFYYAHLSAFSTLAVNGRRVRAGDVLGFVGNTGDARGTPYHLHFEIHPVGLLRLGYDGVVNPTRYLSAWQHLVDVNFPARARAGIARGSTVDSSGGTAPVPGAFLLQVSDISQASGLDRSTLEQALADPAHAQGDGAPVALSG